jgi:hypothetical protein
VGVGFLFFLLSNQQVTIPNPYEGYLLPLPSVRCNNNTFIRVTS